MKKSILYLLCCSIILNSHFAKAYISIGQHGTPPSFTHKKLKNTTFQQSCALPQSQTDLKINNIRARLSSGGDLWWNDSGASYAIQVKAGQQGISTLFAAGLWVGGFDAGSNLKMACATYRNKGNDWFAGPLDENTGTTTVENCTNWDKHFEIFSFEIDSVNSLYKKAARDMDGRVLDTAAFLKKLPKNILGWPALKNQFFSSVHHFALPNSQSYLAPYWDNNSDGAYNPLDGDYPYTFLNKENNVQSSQTVFWVFNDEGSGAMQTSSKGKPLKLEVHGISYLGGSSDSDLQNTTFQRYILKNHNADRIDSTFMAFWVDPQLGCGTDDYIGFDNSYNAETGKNRNMMYVYNSDNFDGDAQCNGFGAEIPMVGIDLIHHMEGIKTSFMYYVNGSVGNPEPAMTDPSAIDDYYRYLNCIWKDGTPLTFGLAGYNTSPTSNRTNYAFNAEPNDSKGWSMNNVKPADGDFRMLMSIGPFRFNPGAIQEFIVSIPTVTNQGGGAVSLNRLRKAADEANFLFNDIWNTWEITRIKPSNPTMESIGLDKTIVLTLKNDKSFANNFNENYNNKEYIPRGLSYTNSKITYYRFEGYKIFQLSGDFPYTEALEKDSSKVRLVAQSDFKNGIKKIYNWEGKYDSDKVAELRYTPIEKVNGADEGLKNIYTITQDAFAKGTDKQLVNHKKYYFVAVAYAYNNFKDFDKNTGLGQDKAYIQTDGYVHPIEATPLPVATPFKYNVGDEFEITRLDGVGIGSHFVEMKEDMHDKILNKTFDGAITYKVGKAPIEVKVFNPLNIKDGEYELTFFDDKMDDAILEPNAKWKLAKKGDPDVVLSDKSIETLNQQAIQKYGFSVNIAQTLEPGQAPLLIPNNGAIGSKITYKDANKPKWFSALVDKDSSHFDFISSNSNDPNHQFSKNFMQGQWYPYSVCEYRPKADGLNIVPYITPTWQNSKNTSFFYQNKKNLLNWNNIDIVFTPDKSKWSRCVVVETNNKMYSDDGLLPKGDVQNMALRKDLSIGSDTNPNAPSDGTTGKSWFPGYAVDVETGQRLAIFFGENSGYDFTTNPLLQTVYQFKQTPTGGDMIWNPTKDIILKSNIGSTITATNLVAGCGHYIYVTDIPYENWKDSYNALVSNPTAQQNLVRSIRWASMPFLADSINLLSYKDGIIPNECMIQLRVDNPYQVMKGVGTNNYHPSYTFKIGNGIKTKDLVVKDTDNQSLIIFPNPSINDNFVTIKNIPRENVIMIFSLDGKPIRRLQNKNDDEITWDLNDNNGQKVATGIYIVSTSINGILHSSKCFVIRD